MVKNKLVFLTLLCSGLLALSSCGMWSDRGSGRSGERSARGSAASGQAASGQSREQITEVQQALIIKGYDPGTTDGLMGTQTQEALRKFQKENGLKVTGTVDAQTAKALGVSASEKATSPARGSSGGGSSTESSGGSSSGSGGSKSRGEGGESGSSREGSSGSGGSGGSGGGGY
jgi:peptidoglycan hydrolase-like protein with peptidoglycan-binding domain